MSQTPPTRGRSMSPIRNNSLLLRLHGEQSMSRATPLGRGWSEEGGEGLPKRGLETDHVISGPMRGLKHTWGMDIRQTYRQTDKKTCQLYD